jgi:hypothetical protein
MTTTTTTYAHDAAWDEDRGGPRHQNNYRYLSVPFGSDLVNAAVGAAVVVLFCLASAREHCSPATWRTAAFHAVLGIIRQTGLQARLGRVHCTTLCAHLVIVLASCAEVSIVSATLSATFGFRGGGAASRALGRRDVRRA